MKRDLIGEFQSIIRTIIGPELKAFGFKKFNLNFNRRINEIVQCINIQKSQYNHSESMLFTINIGIYNSQVFCTTKNKVNEPKVITSDNCFAWTRTGHLIYGYDFWYELNSNKPFEEISDQIAKDFKEHIIPFFKNLQTLDSLIKLLRLNFKDRPFHLIANIDDISILELEFGDFQRGKDILVDNYHKAIIPKSTKHTTIYPDGREEISWSEPSANNFQVEKLIRISAKYKIAL